ncbi:MAG: hypothetical protein JXQ96_18100 [Cyclobacteriaceae bacterium]
MILRTIAILLVSLNLFQPVYNVFVLVDYEMNKGYISAFLCENKDQPELACEGKCYLMQKLEKAAENQENEKQKKLQLVKRIEISELPIIAVFKFSSNLSNESIAYTPAHLTTGQLSTPFRPPQPSV